MSDMPPDACQLKIALSRISPMVWRRVLVRSDLTLYGLHRVIQTAFGWEDFHLHQFKIHGRLFTTQWTGDWHWKALGQEWRLVDLGLRVRQKCSYEYDCGDFWEHEVDLKPGFLHVARLKNGIASTHPIRVPELRALRRDYPSSPYLFVSEFGGPMTPATFRKLVARAGERAKFPLPYPSAHAAALDRL